MENVRAQSTIVLPDGSTPSPPDFICVPFMGLARQTIDRSEKEGNEQQALKVLLTDILDQGEAFRQEGIPLNVFVKGLSKTDDETGYKFSDVVPLDNRRTAAIVKGYGTFTVGEDLRKAFVLSCDLEASCKLLYYKNNYHFNNQT